MVRLALASLLACCLCGPAVAQPEGVPGLWEHYFEQEGRTVYLDLQPRAVIVWSLDDSGKCTRYPGATEWDGKRMRRVGPDWRVRRTGEDLQVAFPDTTVTYRRSSVDPSRLCEREKI
jgi:hypothetical protein